MSLLKGKWIGVILGLAVLGTSGYLMMTLNKKPINIAFVGELSTTATQLSIESRDAIRYAVEEINDNGGLLGKQVEVTAYDDKIDNEYKDTLKAQLDRDQQKLIIGFNVSAMKPTIDYLMAKGDYLIVSPTISTEALNGLDDRFIKVTVGNKYEVQGLIKALELESVKNIGIVYNKPNETYSKGLADMLVEQLEGSDVEVSFLYGDSGKFDSEVITSKIEQYKIDGLVAILNGSDSAKMSQLIAIKGHKFKMFGTSWGATNDFIANSGNTSANTYMLQVKNEIHDPEAVNRFVKWFVENTGIEPTYPAFRAYDACQILFRAVEYAKSTDPEKVKEAIIELKKFQGVDTTLEIDSFGDAVGSYELIKVVNGKFIRIEE